MASAKPWKGVPHAALPSGCGSGNPRSFGSCGTRPHSSHRYGGGPVLPLALVPGPAPAPFSSSLARPQRLFIRHALAAAMRPSRKTDRLVPLGLLARIWNLGRANLNFPPCLSHQGLSCLESRGQSGARANHYPFQAVEHIKELNWALHVRDN